LAGILCRVLIGKRNRNNGFRLVPPPEAVALFARDYRAMRNMYLSDPVTVESFLAVLAELEERINSSTR
jgi:hypothetical protein